ncbi:hypothetical protein MtrunA17_Chr3g0094701 [Medicago truncatula]|uniref:Uncharacterized protein n=1 Tax=Medicago truncatula TaxID=3880 RepID=A0A396IPR7_MEDTR|nr:hypothetical protein MtrunA17_Chr3g0094701 [Medicago truncatula]
MLDFREKLHSARDYNHRSPSRTMILASRVMKFIARHVSHFPSPRELQVVARHNEQPYSP